LSVVAMESESATKKPKVIRGAKNRAAMDTKRIGILVQ